MLSLFKKNIDYKYSIIRYNYHIHITISKYKIEFQYNNTFIIIKKCKIWNGQSTFFIMNNHNISVLHPIIKNNSKELYKQTLSSFKHIDPKLNEKKLLGCFIAILSLQEYPNVTKKFNVFWNNQYIIENYKLLLYKFNFENIIVLK